MRIKRGLTKKRKHKKILSLTKGFRLSYSKLYKRAREAVLHAGKYAFNDRKKRKGDFRELWIERINAGLKQLGMKYSVFIDKLNKNKVELNRKILADLALNDKKVFDEVVNSVK
jgi:large subunit ribosomal protein L20